MTRVRSRRAAAAAAAALVLMTACTGTDDSAPAPRGGLSPSMDEPLEVTAVWTGTEKESFTAVLDAFTRATGVTTRLSSTGEDVASYLDGRVEAGDAPDVALLPQVGLLRSLADRQLLTTLDPESREDVARHQGEFWPQLGQHGGRQYGVVFKVANKSVWWYEPGALAQAGVSPPATLSDVLGAAEDVKRSGTALLSIGAADGWPLTDLFENLYLVGAGPISYDKLARHEISWTDPTVIAALEQLRALATTDGLFAGGPEGVLAQDFPASVADVFGPDARAATVFEGDFVASVIKTAAPQAVTGKDYDFFPFPRAGEQPAVVAGADVAVALTSRPEAQELLAFLATPEAARPWAMRGGFQSPVSDLSADAFPDDVTRRLAAQLDVALANGRVRYDLSDSLPPLFGATAGRGLYRGLQQILEGVPVQEVAATLEAEATDAFRTF